MSRTMIVATDRNGVTAAHVVSGNFNAEQLESLCKAVSKSHPSKLSVFHKALGFKMLRRHTDLLHFVDLDQELAVQHQLPTDIFSFCGISH